MPTTFGFPFSVGSILLQAWPYNFSSHSPLDVQSSPSWFSPTYRFFLTMSHGCPTCQLHLPRKRDMGIPKAISLETPENSKFRVSICPRQQTAAFKSASRTNPQERQAQNYLLIAKLLEPKTADRGDTWQEINKGINKYIQYVIIPTWSTTDRTPKDDRHGNLEEEPPPPPKQKQHFLLFRNTKTDRRKKPMETAPQPF